MGNNFVLPANLPVGSDSVGQQYELQQPMPFYSGIVTIPAGTGITSAPQRAVQMAIPSGASLLVKSIAISLVSGVQNQLLFSLGNIQALPQWSQINAVAFAQSGQIQVNEIINPPFLFVDLFNISGTTFAGAGGPVTVQVTISIDAVLLGEIKRAILQAPGGNGYGTARLRKIGMPGL